MKLALVMALTAVVQIGASGGRLALSLLALGQGGTAATVGMLNAVYALVPALLALQAGRLVDRMGVRVPYTAGAALVIAGLALNAFAPGLYSLFAAATVIGTGHMFCSVATNSATGAIAPPPVRANYYSWVSLVTLSGASTGALVAGYGLDHAGPRSAFLVLAAFPLIALALLAWRGRVLPALSTGRVAARGGAMELLLRPGLTTIFVVVALVSMSWDLYQVIVPVQAAQRGLPAAAIGSIMACFPAGSFATRALIPLLTRRFREWTLITATLAGVGAAFLVLPFVHSTLALAVVVFLLGCGFGFSYPVVMALLFSLTPAGRQGEAIGIRTTMQNVMHVGAPLILGFLGTVTGVLPLCAAVAATMFVAGGFAWRRRRGTGSPARTPVTPG